MKFITSLALIAALFVLGCKKYPTEAKKRFFIAGNVAQLSQKLISDSSIHDGSLADSHIKYFGRWDFSDSTQYQSHWGGAYLKVNFTGTTVKLNVNYATNYYVKIDSGQWTSYNNKTGVIDITPDSLVNKVHSLLIAQGKDNNYVFKFQGLTLDSGAVTSNPSVNNKIIEYIGDSLTTGFTDSQGNISDYAWISSDFLNVEHTQIAYPGICLVDGYPGTGMNKQYFKTESLYSEGLNRSDWLPGSYTPRLLVINLGTNDFLKKVPDATFKSVFIAFCKLLRLQQPGADIFLMRPFSGAKELMIRNVVDARHNAGDMRVHYINTTGWLGGKSDYTDGVHPTDQGQLKIASKLTPILKAYLDNDLTLKR